jgi:phosphoenolpyruvate carboxylase
VPSPKDDLTLQRLAGILRDHMDGTAARFAEVGTKIDDLRREVAGVAGIVRDLSQVVLGQVDEVSARRHELEAHRHELEEYRQHVRQIFARMEQCDARFEVTNWEFRVRMTEHDVRFEAMSQDIRRILDALERRGGDGGGRQP